MIIKESDSRIRVSLPKAAPGNPVQQPAANIVAVYRGDPGAPGRGIKDIEQPQPGFIDVIMDDGAKKRFQLPKGEPGQSIQGKQGKAGTVGKQGKPGRGIESITQPTDDTMKISFTDGTDVTLELPRGKDGREPELRATATHIQWRYVGEKEWRNLLSIAQLGAISEGAGTLRLVASINGISGAANIISSDGTISINVAGQDVDLSVNGTSPWGSFNLLYGQNITITFIAHSLLEFLIDGLYSMATDSGTIDLDVEINGTPVTGLSGLTITSTPQSPVATAANLVEIGDEVTFIFSNNSSAENIRFTIGGSFPP